MGSGLLSCSGRFSFCATQAAGVFIPDFALLSGPVDNFVALLLISSFQVSAPWAFPLGAFSADGTYTSNNSPVFTFDLAQPPINLGFGTLTVSGSPVVSVPAPPTLPSALLALAGAPLWGLRRGRKSSSAGTQV